MAHAAELVAFAEAMVGDDDAALAEARATLLGATSPEVLVDTAAVASNFERMVRIADSTGIPLDAPMEVMTGALREELGIDAFDSAANTQASGRFAHAAAQVAWPAMRRVLSAVGKLASRRL